jgi:hypothetical protein
MVTKLFDENFKGAFIYYEAFFWDLKLAITL